MYAPLYLWIEGPEGPFGHNLCPVWDQTLYTNHYTDWAICPYHWCLTDSITEHIQVWTSAAMTIRKWYLSYGHCVNSGVPPISICWGITTLPSTTLPWALTSKCSLFLCLMTYAVPQTVQHQMVGKTMTTNSRACGKKPQGLMEGTTLAFAWRDWEEPWNTTGSVSRISRAVPNAVFW